MADTGAPYFIPYVEPTDLVRDYPAADEAQADAIAAALDAIPVLAGIGSNVVQTVKTDVFSTTSTSFDEVTGMSVTITPSAIDSKILLLVDLSYSASGGDTRTQLRITGGGAGTYVGDASGLRTRATFSWYNATTTGAAGWPAQHLAARQNAVFLDSPATTSPVTYAIEARLNTGTLFINKSGLDTDTENFPRTASSFTVIEVAA